MQINIVKQSNDSRLNECTHRISFSQQSNYKEKYAVQQFPSQKSADKQIGVGDSVSFTLFYSYNVCFTHFRQTNYF